MALGKEFQKRFGKTHATAVALAPVADHILDKAVLNPGSTTPFANCTPFKGEADPTDAYSCYMVEKWFKDAERGEAPVWTRTSVPEVYRHARGVVRLPRSKSRLPIPR